MGEDAFPSPAPSLLALSGAGDVLLVAPHAPASIEPALPFVNHDVHKAFEAHVDEWHDYGSGQAMETAAAQLGAPGLRPVLPRGLMDLNRGWAGRKEARETLFGKGAIDAWVAANALRDGAREALEGWYRDAMATFRKQAEGRQGFVEVHSYGDLGSTYDKEAGGRPVRRSEAAIVTAVPWASAYPVGLARLLPGDLRGTPWGLERELGDALAEKGFRMGPSPYPSQGPWALSTRFLAQRWFLWLGQKGHLPQDTAEHLAELAWTDEHDAAAEAAASGEAPESPDLQGVRELAKKMGAWSHDAGRLGQEFLAEEKCFTLVVEMRQDRACDAKAFGEAVAGGLAHFMEQQGVAAGGLGRSRVQRGDAAEPPSKRTRIEG